MAKGLNEHRAAEENGTGIPYCGRRGKGIYLVASQDSNVNCRFCLKKMHKNGVKLTSEQTEYLGVDNG